MICDAERPTGNRWGRWSVFQRTEKRRCLTITQHDGKMGIAMLRLSGSFWSLKNIVQADKRSYEWTVGEKIRQKREKWNSSQF